MSNTHQIAGPV